jgi:uncharacterized membrane protein
MPPGLYTYLIFVHVCSVIGLFVALSLEAAAVYQLGSTRATAVVRENLSTLAILEKALPGAALLVLISGLSMVLQQQVGARARTCQMQLFRFSGIRRYSAMRPFHL